MRQDDNMVRLRQLSGLFALWCWALNGQPAFAAEKPLIEVGTETSAPGEVKPSKALVRVVLSALADGDVAQLDGCLAEERLGRSDYGSLLRAVRIRAAPHRDQWFVRPAQEPYCLALYGAHLYRYFWIEENRSGVHSTYRLLFKNGGDGFAVYPQRHHGLNDIEATGCIAVGCRIARLAFDGQEYRLVGCSETTFDHDGREVRRPRNCGSDDWKDDQATGAAPSPAK